MLGFLLTQGFHIRDDFGDLEHVSGVVPLGDAGPPLDNVLLLLPEATNVDCALVGQAKKELIPEIEIAIDESLSGHILYREGSLGL